MSILITILVVIGIVIVSFLIAALFATKEFTVERMITIEKPQREIFEFVRFLDNHKSFSKWTTKESAKAKPGIGTDGEIGYILPWDNYEEKAGVGELEIKQIINGSRIHLEHRYIRPIKGVGNTHISAHGVSENQTALRWVYNGISNYPINLLTSIMNMDNIIGKDLDNSLSKLKIILEKNKKEL